MNLRLSSIFTNYLKAIMADKSNRLKAVILTLKKTNRVWDYPVRLDSSTGTNWIKAFTDMCVSYCCICLELALHY